MDFNKIWYQQCSFIAVDYMLHLTLMMPRAWDIGYMQPFINCQGKSTTHFVYFEVVKLSPRHIWKPLQYIPQQGQSLHIWTTSLSITGCYKNKYTIQFLWMACRSRFAMLILNDETELASSTIRVKLGSVSVHGSRETYLVDVLLNITVL